MKGSQRPCLLDPAPEIRPRWRRHAARTGRSAAVNNGVYYRVKVENAAHTWNAPDADFRCTLRSWAPDGWWGQGPDVIPERRIESRPGAAATARDVATGATLGAGTGTIAPAGFPPAG